MEQVNKNASEVNLLLVLVCMQRAEKVESMGYYLDYL